MNNQMPSFAIHQYLSIGGCFRKAKPASRMMTKEIPWRMEADFWVEPPKRVAPSEAKRANTPARWRIVSNLKSITAGTFRELRAKIKKTRKGEGRSLRIPIQLMKRKLAWLGVILSTFYLLTIGILPDPILFIDEGIALAVLIQCASFLGYDLHKWLPFLPKKKIYPASSRR